jgi:hypothetical protein
MLVGVGLRFACGSREEGIEVYGHDSLIVDLLSSMRARVLMVEAD